MTCCQTLQEEEYKVPPPADAELAGFYAVSPPHAKGASNIATVKLHHHLAEQNQTCMRHAVVHSMQPLLSMHDTRHVRARRLKSALSSVQAQVQCSTTASGCLLLRCGFLHVFQQPAD